MDIELLKELIEKREAIDAEIVAAVGGKPKEKKAIKCGNCDQEGHTARTCPSKMPAAQL